MTRGAGVAFYSDFWPNLHDYLYGIAGGGPDPRAGFEEEAEECLANLPPEALAGWQRARDFYFDRIGERHHRRDPLMKAVRYELTRLGSIENPDKEELLAVLGSAEQGYKACLWPKHYRRNRDRIAELAALLAQHGPSLQARLSRHYQKEWPAEHVIDMVGYSDFAGANTASGRGLPSHTTLSSTDEDVAGFGGLELVLHEASHIIFGFRWGPVTQALMQECQLQEVEVPRELWHALSFYTSGEAGAEWARGVGEDYVPYAKRTGMFEGPFAGYLEPIEEHWTPYISGQVELSSALSKLVAATSRGSDASP